MPSAFPCPQPESKRRFPADGPLYFSWKTRTSKSRLPDLSPSICLAGPAVYHVHSALRPPIAVFALADARCIPLLKVMSYALPFASIHSCICGYSLGLKQTRIPGISQLAEQCARVLGVYLLYTAAMKESGHAGIILAVCGLVIGEIAGSFYSIFAVRHLLYSKSAAQKSTISTYAGCLRSILTHAVPVTANRIS